MKRQISYLNFVVFLFLDNRGRSSGWRWGRGEGEEGRWHRRWRCEGWGEQGWGQAQDQESFQDCLRLGVSQWFQADLDSKAQWCGGQWIRWILQEHYEGQCEALGQDSLCCWRRSHFQSSALRSWSSALRKLQPIRNSDWQHQIVRSTGVHYGWLPWNDAQLLVFCPRSCGLWWSPIERIPRNSSTEQVD